MVPINRHNILKQSQEYFNWIKLSDMTKNKKLNELVDLRNYLTEIYLGTRKRKKFNAFQTELAILVKNIDQCWWELFTDSSD